MTMTSSFSYCNQTQNSPSRNMYVHFPRKICARSSFRGRSEFDRIGKRCIEHLTRYRAMENLPPTKQAGSKSAGALLYIQGQQLLLLL